ncbi:MAG: hypothetical protein LAT68_00220 [Cyclobacteriaceae bacterium]|nr:hypothetical protein [Cyclobacteriaceae bacterium]MCH8514726.1 hypothetical protein [Cyclobacteriaceae bacterium]
MKTNFLFSTIAMILISFSSTAYTQGLNEKTLEELLDARDVLYEEYKIYESTNSSFWGTKSKRDLRNIIDTLKEIIRKDTEIIKAVRVASIERQSQVNRMKGHAESRVNELESENKSLKRRLALQQKSIREIEEQLEELQKARSQNHILWLIIIISVAGNFWLVKNKIKAKF